MAPRKKTAPTEAAHPTASEFIGVCEAVALALVWCEKNQAQVADEVKVLASVRSFSAGSISRLELHGAGAPLGPPAASLYNAPADHPVVLAHATVRKAVLSLVGLALSGKVTVDVWRTWRHELVTMATNAGTLLRVVGADHQVQVAASTAEAAAAAGSCAKGERRGPVEPNSPEFAAQLALGDVLALLRERQKLTREDVAVRTAGAVTAAQLGRLEGGTASASANVGAVAEVLGSTGPEIERLALRAAMLAAQLSATIVGIGGDRWYADALAAYGERFARALVSVAAGAALKPQT